MINKRPLAIQLLAGIGIGFLLLIGYGHARHLIGTESAGLPPAVVLDRTEWDFGKVSAGQALKAQFRIGNSGGRRLILRKTNGGCDCFTAGEAEIFIEPGEHRDLIAELDSTKASGPVRMELDYATNDPRQPLLKLFCTADIR
jgi:hypothetical protein